MAVTTPYDYIDNQELEPDGHNKNVYSKTPGQGIMSEANGGLDTFHASFAVKQEHVWPEEAVRVRQDAATETIDIFSEAHADSGEDVTFRPVAGCSTKVYMPYAATLALWEWSVFISEAHVHIHTADSYTHEPTATFVPLNSSTPAMFIRARLISPSGTVTEIDHTLRHLPKTLGFNATSGITGFKNYEARSCFHFGMHHLQETVTAGWHELSLTLHQEPVTIEPIGESAERTQYEVSINRSLGKLTDFYDHLVYQRASFGIRNARVLTLL